VQRAALFLTRQKEYRNYSQKTFNEPAQEGTVNCRTPEADNSPHPKVHGELPWRAGNRCEERSYTTKIHMGQMIASVAFGS
jgi:hypothetical protein